jgi:hypothetical protein
MHCTITSGHHRFHTRVITNQKCEARIQAFQIRVVLLQISAVGAEDRNKTDKPTRVTVKRGIRTTREFNRSREFKRV